MLMTQGRNLSSIRLVWCMVIWLLTSDSAWGQTFGRLQIRSQPNGATVSITQGPRQVTSKKTPAEWVLQPGTYQVHLSKNGYQDLTFSVKILADKKRSFAKVMQKQATNSGAGNVPVSGTTANHVLEAARQSFRNRKKYYIGNQNDAFFPGALELAKGVVPGEFREVRRFQYSQGPISANGALPGDVFVLRRGNKRDVLVYAGEFRFPDSVSKKNYSFFYYPFRQKSGMQLNTYPMRYEHHWMTSHKLLTPSKNGKQQMYSSGSSHEVAKFVSAKIDRHTVKFLKSPGINGRLIARPPAAEAIVYRRDDLKSLITRDLILAIAPKAKPQIVTNIVTHLPDLLEHGNIRTRLQLAHFLGQCAQESGGTYGPFTRSTENFNYSTAARIVMVWPDHFTLASAQPYVKKPEKLANYIYGVVLAGGLGNDPKLTGEGWRFRGRGLIQLTGRANYKAFGSTINLQPEEVIDYATTPRGMVEVSTWYWRKNSLSLLAERDDIDAVTKKINKAKYGLKERIIYTNRAKKALGL